MVKNLSTIDRGTKVRFGRWHNDDQAENTIVINASDTPINADHAGLFMSPIRVDEGLIVTLMGVDHRTGEVVDSNINAQAVQGREIDFYANLGNVITSTVVYEADNALVTTGNIGISNLEPIHTLDVGSKFSIDENGANIVTIRGDSYIQDNLLVGGNLAVRGTLTTIDTENTTIKDAIVEIGKGNTTSDVGFIMNRPGSNVAVGYRDSVDEFAIAHTDSSASSTTIVPSGELIDVRVHGRLHTNSSLSVDTNLLHVDAVSDRIGINTLFPQSTLDVIGDAKIASNLAVGNDGLYVDTTTSRVGVNTTLPTTDFHVEGEALITGDLNVTSNALISNNLNVTRDVIVTENAYVSNNLTITKDVITEGEIFAKTDLTVTENAYVSNNLTVTKNAYVSNNLTVTKNIITEGEILAKTNLRVTENVYVSNNLTVTKNLTTEGEIFAKTDLTVTENAYVSNNLTVTNDLTTEGEIFAKTDLTVTENAYVSNNLTVTKNLTTEGEIFAKTDLTVTENVYVSNNLTTEGDIFAKTDLTVTENAYVSNNLTVTKNVIVSGDASTTSKTTGALTVVGGIGVQGNVHATHVNFEDAEIDSITVTDTTASTSVTTGAAKIAGGVGVSGSVYASNVIVAGDSYGKFTSSFLAKSDTTTESEAFMKNLNAGERTTQYINGSQSGGTAISTVGEPAGVITVKNPIIINYDIRNWLVGWTELAPWPQPGSLAMNAGAPSEAAYIGNGTAFWWNDVFNFTFVEGLTYIFDISHVSNQVQAGGSGPGYFGITGDQGYGYQSIPYDFGVERIGTQGTSGAQFRWTVPRGASTFQGRSTGSHAGPGNFYFYTKSVDGSSTAPGQTYDRIINVIPNPDDHLLSGQIRISGLLSTDTINVTDTTSSTSTTTGAVKIAGGLGVVGNVYADTFYGDGSNLTGAFSMTSIATTGNVNVGDNISIGALTQNKIPYVGANQYLADSHITHSTDVTTITSNLEVLGNIMVSGNSFAVDSESLVINDRVIGIANNNTSHLFDVGIVMQHPGKNIGLIHHGVATENDPHDHTFTIGYTQNTVTDNHILDDSNLITVEILGNLVTQNNLTVSHDAIISGSTPSTSKITGALQVAGGVGIVGDVYAESGDFSSLVTTSNVATTNLTASDTIHTTNINIIDTVTTTNVSTTNITASDTIHTTNVATTNLTASDTIHTTNVATTNITASDTIHTTNVATTNVTASDTIHTANIVASDTVKVTNGLITNLGGLTRKTYSYSSGTITASTTPEINVVFANQMFSAKITAHLVEPTSNISVLNLDVTGGTGRDIGKGFLSITGDENSKHWNSTIATTDTTVTLTPSVGLISNGTYGIHVEHTSPLGVGGVTSIDKDNTSEATFNY
tara:strand:+ start:27879 stop:31985 length:4107 start_codon:yes stop_codon:yes gene_type:complete